MAFYRKRGLKWEYRISFVNRQTGEPDEATKGGFKTKKEAQLAAAEAEVKIHHYGFAPTGKEKINSFFEKWLEVYKKPHVKPITYSVQERVVRLNILPRWGNYRLREIPRTEYQEWINEISGNYSEGTVRRIHSIMSSALNDAVHEYRILMENPLQKIKIPKITEKNNKISYFTTQELNLFLQSSQTIEKTQNINAPSSITYCSLY